MSRGNRAGGGFAPETESMPEKGQFGLKQILTRGLPDWDWLRPPAKLVS